MILIVFSWWIFLHLHGGIDHTEDEDEGSNVEGVDDGVWDDAFRSHVADANGCEDEGEEVACQRTCIAEERLDGIGKSLLTLVHHITHHHLEGLHGHVDGGVEEHEREESEGHRCTSRHAEGASVGQHAHDEHSHQRTNEEVRNATAKTCPSAVAPCSHERLDNDAHERWQNPEVTEVVRICTQRGEDARDVGRLQGVGYLHSKEAKTDVEQFDEGLIRNLFHLLIIFLPF